MATIDLPQIVLDTVPIPSIILLLVVGLYHITPLLTLLPNVHLSPLLHSLSTLIPTPRRNLPRAFFDLPPRSAMPSKVALEGLSVLSIRDKVILLLSGQSIVGLSCGWAYLAYGSGWPLVAVASTGTLSAIASLSVFSLYRPPSGDSGWLMRGGGITHATIFGRILPLSLVAPVVATASSAAGSPAAPYVVLGISSGLVVVCIVSSMVVGYRLYVTPKKGALRLDSSEAQVRDAPGTIEDSWLTEPCKLRAYYRSCPADSAAQPTESSHISAFSFSPTPSMQTPRPRHNRRSSAFNDTPTSWLTSPSATPHTLPSWEHTPNIATPQVAHTRQRASSSVPPASLPRPIQPARAGRYKTSAATTMTASTFASPGGSILAGYDPDPAQPVPPRGFASLTSFPLSPDEMEMVGGSPMSGTQRHGRDGDAFAFIPEERDEQDPRASSWTLATYCSGSSAPVTPSRNGSLTSMTGRGAPLPSSVPVHIPLPPTPALARKDSAATWGPHAKESRECLMGERDWVEVDGAVEAMDEWSRGGRGVGFLAIVGALVCYVSHITKYSLYRADDRVLLSRCSLSVHRAT